MDLGDSDLDEEDKESATGRNTVRQRMKATRKAARAEKWKYERKGMDG